MGRKPSARVGAALLVVLLGVALVGSASCRTRVTVPPRPEGVAECAAWAGGADGGAWIDCQESNEPGRYSCIIWSDSTGEVIARGTFVESAPSSTGEQVHSPSFSGFGGTRIDLKDGRQLLPDGWIEYPLGDDLRKWQKFNRGTALTEEIQEEIREGEEHAGPPGDRVLGK